MRRLAATTVAVVVLTSACTGSTGDDTVPATTVTTSAAPPTTESPPRVAPTTTQPAGAPLDPDGFHLMLMWHQHQPLYPKDDTGLVTRPWVRVHATKDYLDMATMLTQYPGVRATFNLTPVLMLQLEELAGGTKDVYWALTEVDAAALSDEQRDFVLARFFDTNPKVIARFPRYQELADQRGEAFSEQDLRDLQLLWNLAWTDPDFLAQEPLAALVAKERDYTEDDKRAVLEVHRRIIGQVLAAHAQLWEAGQIELTTTPLAHPILPLIQDTNMASIGDPTALLPTSPFQHPIDATVHVQRGLDLAERLLGRRPVGMWPGEGAVAERSLSLFSREGVQWIATGEDVLAPSLGIGPFQRDGAGTVDEANLLYRPWYGEPNRNPAVGMFFRDRVLSDLVGFQYSGMSGQAAADDFMARLRNAKDRLDEIGAEGPHVVSVILDGENAWEHYDNDGKDFLNALYAALESSDFVRTVTPSQYLEAFGDQIDTIDEVFPGAWFSSNYATWIGEEEEKVAWDYLGSTRNALAAAERSGEATAEQLEAAYEAMYFAEGSDWFWWYGADQNSGNDDYFDAAYRELLGQVYDALGRERPAFVQVPIIPQAAVLPAVSPESLLAIVIDNDIADSEWGTAGRYDAGDSAELVAAMHYGFDTENLYVRVDFSREVLGDDQAGFDLYLGGPGSGEKRAASLQGSLLGFGATAQARWSGIDPVTVSIADRLPRLGTATADYTIEQVAGFDGSRVEFAVPLSALGPLETGDRVTFRLVERNGAVEAATFPAAGPGVAQVPDISNVEIALEAADVSGDDHGPGSYTYPKDGVFVPGSYDLTTFSVGTSGDDVVFTMEVAAAVQNAWGSPNGLSIQTFDIYVDQDPGAGTGARTLIDGRNAALAPGNGWEYGITLEGWEPAIYVAAADGTEEETRPTFKIIVLGDKGRVIARIPLELLGGGDPAEWGYAVALMSQEGFPSGGVRRVRDVLPLAEQWRIGGGPIDDNHTRILDVVWPEEGIQEFMLSDYVPQSGVDAGTLGPDDLPQVPLLTAE